MVKTVGAWLLEIAIGISLAAPAPAHGRCPGDQDDDGAVGVGELVAFVAQAVNGCTRLPRFVDNGDGTLTDNDTRLVWELKVGADSAVHAENLHDADNRYWWSGFCPSSLSPCQPDAGAMAACLAGVENDPEGCQECEEPERCTMRSSGVATVWRWIVELNAGEGFAGHTDWRVPTLAELQSIAGEAIACDDLNLDLAICRSPIWSATTIAFSPLAAWVVPLGTPVIGRKLAFLNDYDLHAVSAVRGGPLIRGQCLGDRDQDGSVSAAELVAAIDEALHGCPPRFADNGDGTITDRDTGLIWEKKIGLDSREDEGNLHDADNTYRWAGGCSSANKNCQLSADDAAACSAGVDGDANGCTACTGDEGTCILASGGITSVWHWLNELNSGAGFAGYTDWRLPTIEELKSIVDYRTSGPSVSAVFHGPKCGPECTDLRDPACSCTESNDYWSARSFADTASTMDFEAGTKGTSHETSFGFPPRARAVRGGR